MENHNKGAAYPHEKANELLQVAYSDKTPEEKVTLITAGLNSIVVDGGGTPSCPQGYTWSQSSQACVPNL